MDQAQINAFLAKIGQIESAGGKYTNHKTVQSGMHAGSAAIGTYGLMPNTIDDVVARLKRDKELTPEVAKISDIDNEDDLKDYIEQNPAVEKQLATKLAQTVLARQPTEEAAAYSWNQGHNLKPANITQDKLDNSDYVQKFRQLKSVVPLQQTAQNTLPAYGESLPVETTSNDLPPYEGTTAVQGFAHGGKATAELDASKDPMNYYRKNAEPSISGLKGIAFYKGGKVK